MKTIKILEIAASYQAAPVEVQLQINKETNFEINQLHVFIKTTIEIIP